MLRAFVHSFAALALLIQALAPAFARAPVAEMPAPTEEAMPCHGHDAPAPDEGSQMPCCPDDLCDCTQMCRAAPAVPQWAPTVALAVDPLERSLLAVAHAAPPHSLTPLRPPITLPG